MMKLIPAMLAIILSPAFAADVVQVPWETSVTTDKFTGVTATTAKTIIVMPTTLWGWTWLAYTASSQCS